MNREIGNLIEATLSDKILSVTGNRIRMVSGKNYFLKSGVKSASYACEANGLKELSKSGVLRVARPMVVTDTFILTEYIEPNCPTGDFFVRFGRSLARMHRIQCASFGFYEDNYIGLTRQKNCAEGRERTSWAAFYWDKRLLFQYQLAERNGLVTPLLKRGFRILENRLEQVLNGSEEPPSLLHGDLWSGNFICDQQNEPVLIDPAVYYGHREADLAMTKLFGGFPASFYAAYQEAFPLIEGWKFREGIYRLYHLMNHLNLFGTGYLLEAESVLSAYLK
jgi:protein-ribulosamine 3-kinase